MKRTKWNPRKVLIASAGVASVNYALAAGCGGESSVANLVICPPSQCPPNGSGGASVANLVAPPPGGNSFGGNSFGASGGGGFSGASVANLVAPPPGGTPNLPNPNAPDASPGDAGAHDAGAV